MSRHRVQVTSMLLIESLILILNKLGLVPNCEHAHVSDKIVAGTAL